MSWQDIMPKKFETLYSDPKIRDEINELLPKFSANPIFTRISELFPSGYESITSSMLGAIARMHDVVVEAAQPNLIARQLVQVIRTSDPIVRFPKAKRAKAYRSAELAQVWITGEKYEVQDVKADLEIRAAAEWTRKFLEDAPWSVLERQAAELGRAVGLLETEEVIGMFMRIPEDELAGGSEVIAVNDGKLSYEDVVNARRAVLKEMFHPDCLLVSVSREADLWKDDKFIHSFYFGETVDKQRGVLGNFLGLELIVDNSGSVPDNKAFVIDRKAAGVLLVRRDLTISSYETMKDEVYGIMASERIGMEILRSKAVARISI
ncbi:MAG: hypothetical protein LZ159_02520 [Thaumarchaeota archaeon]|jgi:hypothetical protein|nr:hypothetical protein [Candidatus Terraquivivens yellowstonensis]